MSEFRLLIAGDLAPGAMEMEVIDPATGEVFATAPRASEGQLEAAVEAAARAYPAWSALPIEARAACVLRLAEAVEAEAEEIARLLVRENGMPLRDARVQVMLFGIKLRDAAAADLAPRSLAVGGARTVTRSLRPLGPAAAIIPWNVPLVLLGGKIGPALMLGNTVVAKPAPTTPLASLRIGMIAADLLPAGVLNIVTDAGELGAQLASHPQIRLVAFTGSTETGRKVAAAAGAGLRRVLLELGGNDPAVVLPDADVELTADVLYASAFFNAGQACIATKRVYVHERLHDDLVAALGDRVASAVVGSGFDEAVTCGPLQNRAQYERAQRFLAVAESEGTIAARAANPAAGRRPGTAGFFMPPALVTDLPEESALVTEEQFCPLLPILRYTDPDDAVRRANATPYGLAASVFGRDRAYAADVASRLDAGTVAVNKAIDFDARIPFAGAKASGIGVENGEEGLLHYAQLQIVNAAL